MEKINPDVETKSAGQAASKESGDWTSPRDAGWDHKTQCLPHAIQNANRLRWRSHLQAVRKEFENPKDASYAGDSGRPYHQFRTYINYAADTLYFNDHHITVDPRNLTLIGIRFGRFQFNERERRLDGIKRFLSPIGENAIAQQKIQNLAFRSTKHWKKVLRKHSLAPVLMRLKSLQNFTLVLEDEYDSCSDEPHKPAKYFSDAALEKSRASREKRLSNAVSRIDEGFRSWEGVREFADVPEGSTAMKLNFSITGVVRE